MCGFPSLEDVKIIRKMNFKETFWEKPPLKPQKRPIVLQRGCKIDTHGYNT